MAVTMYGSTFESSPIIVSVIPMNAPFFLSSLVLHKLEVFKNKSIIAQVGLQIVDPRTTACRIKSPFASITYCFYFLRDDVMPLSNTRMRNQF